MMCSSYEKYFFTVNKEMHALYMAAVIALMTGFISDTAIHTNFTVLIAVWSKQVKVSPFVLSLIFL